MTLNAGCVGAARPNNDRPDIIITNENYKRMIFIEVCFARIQQKEIRAIIARDKIEDAQGNWKMDYALSSFAVFSKNAIHEGGAWYADSGATKHMSDQKWMFINFKEIVPGNWPVKGIGNVKPLQVHGRGVIPIRTKLNGTRKNGILRDTLYVPKLGANLFSVRSATRQGCLVEFGSDRVNIKRGDKVVTTGTSVKSNLYRLEIVN